jgi:hypothetical protein
MNNHFRVSMARMSRIPIGCLMSLIFLTAVGSANWCFAQSVESARLTAVNWDQFVPSGKEVDAIYGDIVLRNEKIVVVIAQPSANRNANMTVRDVGGSIIDLSSRAESNDQLSCFYPGGNQLLFHDAGISFVSTRVNNGPVVSVQVQIRGKTAQRGLPAVVKYGLNSGDAFLAVTTTISNETDSKFALKISDSVRADRTFKTRVSDDGRLIAFYDPSFHQAYGIFGVGDFENIVLTKPKNGRKKI